MMQQMKCSKMKTERGLRVGNIGAGLAPETQILKDRGEYSGLRCKWGAVRGERVKKAFQFD